MLFQNPMPKVEKIVEKCCWCLLLLFFNLKIHKNLQNTQQYKFNWTLFDTETQWKLNVAEKGNRKSNNYYRIVEKRISPAWLA